MSAQIFSSARSTISSPSTGRSTASWHRLPVRSSTGMITCTSPSSRRRRSATATTSRSAFRASSRVCRRRSASCQSDCSSRKSPRHPSRAITFSARRRATTGWTSSASATATSKSESSISTGATAAWNSPGTTTARWASSWTPSIRTCSRTTGRAASPSAIRATTPGPITPRATSRSGCTRRKADAPRHSQRACGTTSNPTSSPSSAAGASSPRSASF